MVRGRPASIRIASPRRTQGLLGSWSRDLLGHCSSGVTNLSREDSSATSDVILVVDDVWRQNVSMWLAGQINSLDGIPIVVVEGVVGGCPSDAAVPVRSVRQQAADREARSCLEVVSRTLRRRPRTRRCSGLSAGRGPAAGRWMCLPCPTAAAEQDVDQDLRASGEGREADAACTEGADLDREDLRDRPAGADRRGRPQQGHVARSRMVHLTACTPWATRPDGDSGVFLGDYRRARRRARAVVERVFYGW